MGYYNDYLEHHGILGQKHGRRNGPPYPLGQGDHSSAEKKAASAAGVKVGSDSGKGSIENVKKKKTPLTEEEKRMKAEEARLKGDSKNINKYMDKLTTQELQDAQTRANIRKSLTEEKQSKADRDKLDAVRSGDKEKVKEYATKMSYNELVEAMNKVDLMQKLNYKPPEPTTMDKINSAMKKVDTARDWMDKGLKAYDALAAINNTFNKEHQWPRAEFGGNKGGDQKKGENKFESVAKKVMADAQNAKAENERKENRQIANRQLDQNEEALKFEQRKYSDQQKKEQASEKQARKDAKAEERQAKKEQKDAEKEQENAGYEKVKGKEYAPEIDPFKTSGVVDADYRDIDIDTPSPTGDRYLERYYLEDKERN